jgi:hypothetical protein
VVAATETIPAKRRTFESSVGQAKEQSQIAFNLDTSKQGLNFLGTPRRA